MIKIEIVTWTDAEGYECETCGWQQDNGSYYLLNGKNVWEQSSTGCYGGTCTEGSVLNALFAEFDTLSVEQNWFEYWHDSVVPEDEMDKLFESIKSLGLDEAESELEVLAICLRDLVYQKVEIVRRVEVVKEDD